MILLRGNPEGKIVVNDIVSQSTLNTKEYY